ncbi:helix-turn-helix domain-containing protein [Psychrobacillus vulpis]|uniref:Helix-turn-helix transcriptional regulator n=1 Tax=Psychrobacillus vulpis TaxID=2325572 RepID=A0A544TJA9_9BACI|nr:helix-turn-helix transcriptional regulator [Psychrobacillus vulpis]TQR17547.1 helix-turn-helix transcriptional regulator [Psychrobacillus vulpis]
MKKNLLNKKSSFGDWLDIQKDISIYVLEEASGISYSTISKLCNTPNYLPRFSTIAKINEGLKVLGKSVNLNDYF